MPRNLMSFTLSDGNGCGIHSTLENLLSCQAFRLRTVMKKSIETISFPKPPDDQMIKLIDAYLGEIGKAIGIPKRYFDLNTGEVVRVTPSRYRLR
jgi:hypothetical protein